MEAFIVITELTTPAGVPTKEAKAEIETYHVTVQAKIRNAEHNLILTNIFMSYLLTHFA